MLLLLLIIAIYVGWIQIPGLKLPGQVTQQPPTTQPPTEEGVIVTKQLKFSFVDKYAGSAASGTAAYLYDSDGKTQLEGGGSVISTGVWTTTNSYRSGQVLWVKYVSGNSIYWQKITVPRMSQADAESLSVNPIRIDVFSICTLTDALRDGFGNNYNDGASWNITAGGVPGQTTGTLTYSWYVSADNTGYIESYDPIYGINLKPVLYVTLSGTNYEKVILSGFDGAFEKGTTMYYYKVLDPTTLTKWKVGNNYVYVGSGSFTFSIDLTGYSGDNAVLQIYLYVYSDPAYFQTYASFGPYAVQLAEQTLNLRD